MPRTHDMGGRPSEVPLNREEHALADWEVLADAMAIALGAKGLRSTDEMRRGIEDMPPAEYLSASYYERWIRSTEQVLIEKGVLSSEEIDRKMAELEPTWGES